MEVANLNFWCSSSFCVSSSGVTAQPHRRPGHAIASQLSGPFPAPAHCKPCVWVCSSTPGQGAIKADAPLQLSLERLAELWRHLMRKVQVFLGCVESMHRVPRFRCWECVNFNQFAILQTLKAAFRNGPNNNNNLIVLNRGLRGKRWKTLLVKSMKPLKTLLCMWIVWIVIEFLFIHR